MASGGCSVFSRIRPLVRLQLAAGTPVPRAQSDQKSVSVFIRPRVRLQPLYPHLQIALETEVTNAAALRLYESLGFIRDKRLPKYYLNGNDAFRLKCWLR